MRLTHRFCDFLLRSPEFTRGIDMNGDTAVTAERNRYRKRNQLTVFGVDVAGFWPPTVGAAVRRGGAATDVGGGMNRRVVSAR